MCDECEREHFVGRFPDGRVVDINALKFVIDQHDAHLEEALRAMPPEIRASIGATLEASCSEQAMEQEGISRLELLARRLASCKYWEIFMRIVDADKAKAEEEGKAL